MKAKNSIDKVNWKKEKKLKTKTFKGGVGKQKRIRKEIDMYI